jgi:hypothetical protein
MPRKQLEPDLHKVERARAMRLARMQGRLDGLTGKALSSLERALDEGGAVSVSAAKEILDRAWGRARQQVQVSGTVEHSHQVHLEALRMMTQRQIEATQGQAGPVIDAKPLETLENITPDIKQPIKQPGHDSAPVDRAEPVTVSPDSDENPPPVGGNTGGGA